MDFFLCNSTSTVTVLWALHSSESVKRNERLDSSSGSNGTLQMRRPAGERTAPFGPSSSWKRSAEPSGSDAANWKTKFSPANVRRPLWGRWKAGGSLTEDRRGKTWEADYNGVLKYIHDAVTVQSSNLSSLFSLFAIKFMIGLWFDDRISFLSSNKLFYKWSYFGKNIPWGCFWKNHCKHTYPW